MRRAALRFSVALSLSLITFSPARGRADPAADAKNLFAMGRDLRAHGDCAGALPVFRSVYVIYPAGLGSLRNIAECEEAVGQFASAHASWLDLQHALATNSEAKYAGWSEDAAQGVARAGAKMATLVVSVSRAPSAGQAGPGDGITVTLNGEALPPALWSTSLLRDPGRYVLRVQAAGRATSEETVVYLGPGDTHRIVLRPPPPAPRNPPAHDSSLPLENRPSDAAPSTPSRSAGWVSLGVGLASLVGSGIALVVRQNALDELGNQCPNYATAACPASVHPTADRGQTASTVAEVLGVVGAAGVAAGVVLWTLPSRHASSERGPSASVALVPSGLVASGSF